MKDESTKYKIKGAKILIKDMEVILKRLNQDLEELEKSETCEPVVSNRLEHLNNDMILCSQSLSGNINIIVDILKFE